MKPNKSYVKSSLAVQMVLIPVILTLGLIGALRVLGGQLLPQDMGKDTGRFIYLLIAFFVPLLIGSIVGYIFKQNIGNKAASMKRIYTVALIPIIYTLVFAALAVIVSPQNYNSGLWGAYLFKNPILIVFHFILFFSGFYHLAMIAELMAYTGFALGIHLNEFRSKVDSNRTLVKVHRMYALVLIIPIAFSGLVAKDIVTNGIIEIRYGESTIGTDLSEYDLYRIAPFKENNGLAKLDKTASLQFNNFNDMPRLDGATAAYPVYAAFVEAVYTGLGNYYKENENNTDKDIYSAFVSSEEYPLNIVQCTKTSNAYERLINGETDIIFAAEPSKNHRELIESKGDGFALTPIASEAFVFFTNVKNPVDNLTIKQIQEIYSGNITNWKEVNGQNKRILPYQRPENSGSQTVMQNRVMKEVPMLAPTEETYAGGMGEIISRVANYKNAINSIGYSFMYYSSEMVKNNQIKRISIDGIEPSPENIRNKTYPFTVPVYAVTLKSNDDENVDKFIQWILSEEGQILIENTGYVAEHRKE